MCNNLIREQGAHGAYSHEDIAQVVYARDMPSGSVRPVVDTDLVGGMEGSWPNVNKGALKMRNGLNKKKN